MITVKADSPGTNSPGLIEVLFKDSPPARPELVVLVWVYIRRPDTKLKVAETERSGYLKNVVGCISGMGLEHNISKIVVLCGSKEDTSSDFALSLTDRLESWGITVPVTADQESPELVDALRANVKPRASWLSQQIPSYPNVVVCCERVQRIESEWSCKKIFGKNSDRPVWKVVPFRTYNISWLETRRIDRAETVFFKGK